MTPVPFPKALRIVALLHLVFGILAVAGILAQLARGHLDFDFGVLGIPIYFGLLRLSSAWRIVALVFLGGEALLAAFAGALCLMVQEPTTIDLLGIPVAIISPLWFSLVAFLILLLDLWQLDVLLRSDVRALFSSVAPH